MVKLTRALSVIAFIAAPFAVAQAMANAQYPIPGLESFNGFRQEALASRFIDVEEQEGAPPLVTLRDSGRKLALSAFAKEPLATDALLLLAADAASRGAGQQSSDLLAAGGTLEKRNARIVAYQLQDLAQKGRITEAFNRLGDISRINKQVAKQTAVLLTNVPFDEATIAIFDEALKDKPAWAKEFWESAPANAAAVDGLLELRKRHSFATSDQSDGFLMLQLIAAQRYRDAFDLWNLARDGDVPKYGYLEGTTFPPLGWQVQARDDIEASELRDGGFFVFAKRELRAPLAWQLVRLTPGRYRFEVETHPADIAEGLRAGLQCVDSESVEWKALEAFAEWQVGPGCEYHWLRIEVDSWNTGEIDGSIDRLTFSKVG